jgi:hypothetical protein
MSELVLGNTEQVALVDDDDFIRFNGFNWYLKDDGYVITDSSKPRRKLGVSHKLKLHRLITACPEGMDVDHINGNKLDNRKANLRVCTRSENLFNQGVGGSAKHSKLKGAYYDNRPERCLKWFSMISIPNENRNKFLGSFTSAEEAHEAYKKASLELHGEYSVYKGQQRED